MSWSLFTAIEALTKTEVMTATLRKESIYLKLAYRFRGLVHCLHGGRYGGTQADTMLKKEPRVLHLYPQAAGRGRDAGPGLSF